MSQVEIKINGRQYQVSCEDGQEGHLTELAEYFDGKMTSLINEVGQIGDTSLMVMAGLLIAEELSDATQELKDLRQEKDNDYANRINEISEKIEKIADSMR